MLYHDTNIGPISNVGLMARRQHLPTASCAFAGTRDDKHKEPDTPPLLIYERK